MATANQIKTLIKSHFEENNEKFNTVALQIAAHEAKLGHSNLANDIKQIIDNGKKTSPKLKPLNSELQGLVLEVESDKKLSDLIVPSEIKDRINRIIREFTHRNKLLSHNLENRRKILFSGPPGTGKTMSASIIANELHLPIYVILMDKVVTKYMGETSAKLRQIFDLIMDRPAVYLFDEFDAIQIQRGKDNESESIECFLFACIRQGKNQIGGKIIKMTNGIKDQRLYNIESFMKEILALAQETKNQAIQHTPELESILKLK